MGDECWRKGVDRAVQEELGTALPEGYQVVVCYAMICKTSSANAHASVCFVLSALAVCTNLGLQNNAVHDQVPT
jgi:hypothetical protein